MILLKEHKISPDLRAHTACFTITKQQSHCFNQHKSCLLHCFMFKRVNQLQEHEFISCQHTATGRARPGNFHHVFSCYVNGVTKQAESHGAEDPEVGQITSQLDNQFLLVLHTIHYFLQRLFCNRTECLLITEGFSENKDNDSN